MYAPPLTPDVSRYRRLADELARALEEGPAAVEAWARQWPDGAAKVPPQGASAEDVIAGVHGFESWQVMERHLTDLVDADSPTSRFERAADAVVDGDVATLR